MTVTQIYKDENAWPSIIALIMKSVVIANFLWIITAGSAIEEGGSLNNNTSREVTTEIDPGNLGTDSVEPGYSENEIDVGEVTEGDLQDFGGQEFGGKQKWVTLNRVWGVQPAKAPNQEIRVVQPYDLSSPYPFGQQKTGQPFTDLGLNYHQGLTASHFYGLAALNGGFGALSPYQLKPLEPLYFRFPLPYKRKQFFSFPVGKKVPYPELVRKFSHPVHKQYSGYLNKFPNYRTTYLRRVY